MPWNDTLVMLGFTLFVLVTSITGAWYAVYRFERKYGKAGQTGAPPAE
ncbi:hypothetical protein ABZT49_07625 [Methylobacterium sp. EM32]